MITWLAWYTQECLSACAAYVQISSGNSGIDAIMAKDCAIMAVILLLILMVTLTFTGTHCDLNCAKIRVDEECVTS